MTKYNQAKEGVLVDRIMNDDVLVEDPKKMLNLYLRKKLNFLFSVWILWLLFEFFVLYLKVLFPIWIFCSLSEIFFFSILNFCSYLNFLFPILNFCSFHQIYYYLILMLYHNDLILVEFHYNYYIDYLISHYIYVYLIFSLVDVIR